MVGGLKGYGWWFDGGWIAVLLVMTIDLKGETWFEGGLMV